MSKTDQNARHASCRIAIEQAVTLEDLASWTGSPKNSLGTRAGDLVDVVISREKPLDNLSREDPRYDFLSYPYHFWVEAHGADSAVVPQGARPMPYEAFVGLIGDLAERLRSENLIYVISCDFEHRLPPHTGKW